MCNKHAFALEVQRTRDLSSTDETQLTTEKCMEKFKLRLDAFVCGYTPKILAFSSSLVTLKFSIHKDFKSVIKDI